MCSSMAFRISGFPSPNEGRPGEFQPPTMAVSIGWGGWCSAHQVVLFYVREPHLAIVAMTKKQIHLLSSNLTTHLQYTTRL